MPRRAHALALTVILFAALPSPTPAREAVRPGSAPQSVLNQRPDNLPPDDRLEESIRQVYRTYETTVAKSGHDLRFHLREFQTIPRHEFDDYLYLDVMPPDGGMRIVQNRTYYEAPWLRVGKVVHYGLHWAAAPSDQRRVAEQKRELLAGASIARTLQLDRELSRRDLDPMGITTFVVDVEFAGRRRTYRASASWHVSDQDTDQFTMDLVDEVVPEVESASIERALPLPADEFERIQQPPGARQEHRSTPGGRLKAAPIEQGCEVHVDELINPATVTLSDRRGHQSGEHEAQLRMAADCHYTADCRVQCEPEMFFKACAEVGDVDLPFPCTHTPFFDPQVSGASGVDRAVSCGGAIACGIKECCALFGDCGGVSFSFSGTGSGLTASVSNTDSGLTYNLSISDSIECAAPTEPAPEPCSGSSLTGEARIAAATCVDGPEGGAESPPGDGTECSNNCWESPILIDLDGGNIALTDLEEGVSFDIEPDGEVERIAWTVAGSRDAFLALDRDGDGLIENGAELFGNNTVQLASVDPNGFRALQVFDLPDHGGDSDGWLTERDAVFSELLLWRDVDHDGRSAETELLSLPAAGVEAIELSHVDSRHRDRHGNRFRYKSTVRLQRSTTLAVDVFLLSQ